jgi:hypothetical protein
VYVDALLNDVENLRAARYSEARTIERNALMVADRGKGSAAARLARHA